MANENDGINILRSELRILEQKVSLANDVVEEAKLALQYKQKLMELEAKENEELLPKKLDSLAKEIEFLKEEENIIKAFGEARSGELKQLEIRRTVLEKQFAQANETLEAYKEQNRILELQLQAHHRIQADTASFLARIGIRKETYTNSIWGSLEQSRTAGLTFSEIFKEHGAALKENLTLSTIWGGAWEEMWTKTIQLAEQLDSTLAQFNKETGSGGQYDSLIKDLGTDHRSLGVDLRAAAEAVKALKTEMLAFTTLNRSEQAELALTTATLQEMGVGAGDTAKGFDVLVSGLGMSSHQAVVAQKEIMATAKALGVSFGDMGRDFARFAGELTSYGSQTTTVFRELATQAKALKMGMGDLISLADKFDTFEDAATTVGKLNAMLGEATFNSTQFLNATGPERTKLLVQGFKDMGISFDSLNRQQALSYAEILGFGKDTSKLQKLLAGDLTATAKAAHIGAMSEEELAAAAAKSQTMTEQFRKVMMAFGSALAPVVELVNKLLTGLLKLNEATDGILIPGVFGLIGAYVLWTKIAFIKNAAQKVGLALDIGGAQAKKILALETKLAAAADEAATIAKNANTAASGPATAATLAQGAAAKATNFSMLLLGAAILLMGAGLAIAAYGFSKLAESMKGMSSGEILGLVAIVGLLAVAIVALAFTSVAATGPIIALGVAFLLLGGGFALMGWGVSMMAKAAPVMIQFGLAMIGVGAGALMAAIALPILAFSMVLMAGALALIPSGSLMALGYMFHALGTFSSGSASSITSLASAIQKIGQAIEDMPSGKTVLFTTAMEAISSMPELDSSTVSNTTRLVDQTIRYRVSQEQSKAAGVETLVDLFRSNTAPAAAGSSAAPPAAQPVILQINDHALAKFIVEVVNNKVNIR